jgi:hypothetical protein
VAVALGASDHGVDDGGTLAGGDPPRWGQSPQSHIYSC